MIFKNKDFIKTIFERIFRKLGVIVANHPLIFIIIPIILTAVLSTGFFFMEVSNDPEYLFTISKSPIKDNKAFIQSTYPSAKSQNYDFGRETKLISGLGRVLIRPKDGKSIFRRKIRNSIIQLDKMIENINIEFDNKEYSYEALCSRYYGKCNKNPLLFLYDFIGDYEKGNFSVEYPLYLAENKIDFYMFGMAVGNVTLNEEGKLTDSNFGHLYYFLDTSTPEKEKLSILWENKYLEILLDKEFDDIDISIITSQSLPTEFVNSANKALPIFRLTITLVILFASITCMMQNCTKSKPWLGVAACVSSLMGVASGFGICMACKLPFPPSNFAVPFILIGIGIDDTFIFLSSWRNTNSKLSLQERISDTFAQSGVAITVTSFTNIISFLSCILTQVPGIEIFGIYAAISCIFTYLYQITFIGGILTLLGKGEAANMNGNLLFFKAMTKEKLPKCFPFKWIFVGDNETGILDENPKDHAGMAFFRDVVGEFLTKPYAKIFVILMFVGYLGFALNGLKNLEEGMEFKDLFTQDSYAFKFWNIETKYLSKYSYRLQIVINETLDYSQESTQIYIESLLDRLALHPNIVKGSLLTESWLFYYLTFLNHTESKFWTKGYDLTKKSDFINCLRFVFFKMPQAQRFKYDVAFNDNFTEIISSRYIIQSYEIWDIYVALDCIRSSFNLLANEPYKMFAYHPYFIFLDTVLNITSITLSTIAITIAAILVVTFIFMPDVVLAVWVALTIVSIETGVIGYMYYLGFSMNPPSVFGLIMFLGLSVDNAAHLTYAFVSSKAKTSNEKLKDSLYHVGMPIFQGCISTVIGLSALSLIHSYLYDAIYKIGILVMTFSAFHSVALLPVLLSIFHDWGKCGTDKKIKPFSEEKNLKEQVQPFIHML